MLRDKNGRFASKAQVSGFPQKAQLTRVAIVLDKSGSMTGYTNETIRCYNEVVNSMKLTGHNIELSLVMFNDFVNTVLDSVNINSVNTLSGYYPGGSTALYDGIGNAIKLLKGKYSPPNVDIAYLVVVITDGCENVSRNFTAANVSNDIKTLQGTDKWTFAFNVPPSYKGQIMSRLGVPEGNIREWESSGRGMEETQVYNQVGTQAYFSGRSRGLTKSASFYDVDVDLKNLNKSQIKNNLDDISNQFKVLTVEKEMPVRDFVEQKTAKPYVIGSAYYELTKTEKVQPTKNVLIMEKGKNAVWGGNQARDLIGLPTDGVSIAKVEPHNLMNYRVFITSTSVNRKLVRGTKVLLDTTKHVNSQPTWGGVAA